MLLELAALPSRGSIDTPEQRARGLELARQIHDYGGRVFGVGVLAIVASVTVTRSAPGAVGRDRDDDVRAPLGGWPRHRAACEARLVMCSGPVLQRAIAAGHQLSLDDAVALALDDT